MPPLQCPPYTGKTPPLLYRITAFRCPQFMFIEDQYQGKTNLSFSSADCRHSHNLRTKGLVCSKWAKKIFFEGNLCYLSLRESEFKED